MTILYVLLCIGALVLNIILIVKFWIMADDVKAIRNMMQPKTEFVDSHSGTNPPIAPGVTESGPIQDPMTNSVRKTKIPTNLEKGKNYNLCNLGVCTYEGIYDGKHGFYPVKDIDKSSIYFRDAVEPYYLIPDSDLDKVLA